MSTPVFDIIPNETAAVDWQLCRLVIEVNPNYFYYTVINDSNHVVALKYYQLNYNNTQEMVNALEETLHEDPVLTQKMFSVKIIFNWPENCLVPANHFDKNLNRDMLTMLHGYLSKGLVLSEKVKSSDIVVVYRIPPVLDHFLQKHFPASTYSHYYSLWLDCKGNDDTTPVDHVSIVFNPNEIVAAVFKNRQLQVMQNFKYQTPEDIAWHMLNIYQRFNLSQEDTALLVGGMIDQNSAMYAELLKFFRLVELDSMPGAITVPEQFQAFPEHFFSPLLGAILIIND